MKNIISILLLIFLTSSSKSSFEGVLKYKKEYILKTQKFTIEELKESRGDEAIKYIKNNNYKWSVNYLDEKIGDYIYKGKENKNYNIGYKLYHYSISDYSVNKSPVLKDTIIKGFKEFKGEMLDAYVYVRNNNSDTIILSNSYFLNPSIYRKHKANNYYETLKRTNGRIPVIKIHQNDNYITIFNLISAKETALNDSEFNIPIKVKLK